MRIAKLTVGLVALISVTACILSDTRHTLYLEPEGAVDWVVLETEVRASGSDVDKREREERKYLKSARRSRHPAADGLRALGAPYVDTRILRDERPYTIETKARFPAVDTMFAEFFRALDVDTDARLERVAGGQRLTIRLSGIEPDGEVELEDEDDPVLGLIESDFRIVLTDGEFTDVRGFSTTDHEDTVVLAWETLDDQITDDGTLSLSLTWKFD